MTKDKALWLATWIDYKGYDFEKFSYCDNAYNLTDEQKEEVWEYVIELNEIGSIAFREKYKDYKLF